MLRGGLFLLVCRADLLAGLLSIAASFLRLGERK
jgi:hypothetical protein